MKVNTLKKYILFFIGTISLVLGFAGIFIPVLPTTPFLLVSSFCYLRSSKRMYKWLINNKIFGPYIYNYFKYRAIPGKTKIIAILFLWSTLIISIIFVQALFIRLLLITVGVGVTIHLLTLKTLHTLSFKDIEPE